MDLLTTKYAPKNSQQVFGQAPAVQELKEFILHYKKSKQKAVLLYGPTGNGKTSSVYALAKELQYDLLELNSSDLRNEAHMSTFLGAALGQQSLFFKPKMILIDEVDNLSGMYDRGGLPALLKALEKSSFPVILTVNDPFEPQLKALKKACKLIEFVKLDHKTVAHALQWVCEQEAISFEPKGISGLARQVEDRKS